MRLTAWLRTHRLPFVHKFVVIGVLLLTPFAYTTHVMIKNLDQQIVFNQKESYGVKYITSSIRLLENVQDCRNYQAAILAGDGSYAKKVQLVKQEIADLIPLIDAVDTEFKEDFKTEAGKYACTERWNDIKQAWAKIKDREFRTQEDSYSAYSNLCSLMTDWILNFVANFSNLILDPDLDSYWLMDAFVGKLPTISEDIGKACALSVYYSSRTAATGRLQPLTPEERLELSGLYTDANKTLDALLTVNMKTAYDFNNARRKGLQSRLDSRVQASVHSSRELLRFIKDRILLPESPKYMAADVIHVAQESLDSVYALYAAIAPELDNLIAARVGAYRHDKSLGTLAAEGATVLHVYIFIALYLALRRSIDMLGKITRRMIAGTSETFTLGTYDEMGRIATLYNDINSELVQTRALKAEIETDKLLQMELNRKLTWEIAYREHAEQDRAMMETQLRQAQKLESIGQLAAGVAHEINTPTQYIGDNLRFLQEGFDGLLKAGHAHGEYLDMALRSLIPPEPLQAAKAELASLDIDYLQTEVPTAIGQALDGVKRISEIVDAMKDFSHPGQKEKTNIDVNRAVQSTVTVSRNEWKYVADVECVLASGLPPLHCLAGEFNQVILNLIVNAAHAIADTAHNGENPKGKITIRTLRDGEWIEIQVSDTGTGIPENIRDRIFDPFFTTKEIGRGTGQGLAIAQSVIVNKHGGTLTFETETGRGTTFRIRIPVEPDIQNARRKSGAKGMLMAALDSRTAHTAQEAL